MKTNRDEKISTINVDEETKWLPLDKDILRNNSSRIDSDFRIFGGQISIFLSNINEKVNTFDEL